MRRYSFKQEGNHNKGMKLVTIQDQKLLLTRYIWWLELLVNRPGRFWPDAQTWPYLARKFRIMNTIFQPKTRNYPNSKKNGSSRVGYGSTRRVSSHAMLRSCHSVGPLELGLFSVGYLRLASASAVQPSLNGCSVCNKWTGWTIIRTLTSIPFVFTIWHL